MPLKSGSSQETISQNIAIERRAHPSIDPKQAAAIAYSKARGDGMSDKFDRVVDAVASLAEDSRRLKDRVDSVAKRRSDTDFKEGDEVKHKVSGKVYIVQKNLGHALVCKSSGGGGSIQDQPSKFEKK